jgi:hypothetical protein
MSSHEMGIAAPWGIAYFRDFESTHCPGCETRFPLQILVAELLRKNQMLRFELQEALGRLSAIDAD